MKLFFVILFLLKQQIIMRQKIELEKSIKDETEYLFEISEKYPTYYDHEEEEKLLKNKLEKNDK